MIGSIERRKSISPWLRQCEAYCPVCYQYRGIKYNRNYPKGLLVKRCKSCALKGPRRVWKWVNQSCSRNAMILSRCEKCDDYRIMRKADYIRYKSRYCLPCELIEKAARFSLYNSTEPYPHNKN